MKVLTFVTAVLAVGPAAHAASPTTAPATRVQPRFWCTARCSLIADEYWVVHPRSYPDPTRNLRSASVSSGSGFLSLFSRPPAAKPQAALASGETFAPESNGGSSELSDKVQANQGGRPMDQVRDILQKAQNRGS